MIDCIRHTCDHLDLSTGLGVVGSSLFLLCPTCFFFVVVRFLDSKLFLIVEPGIYIK